MTEQQVLELVRKELLAILEDANERSRHGERSGGFGTSEADMSAGRGTATEYLVQVVRDRLQGARKESTESRSPESKGDAEAARSGSKG